MSAKNFIEMTDEELKNRLKEIKKEAKDVAKDKEASAEDRMELVELLSTEQEEIETIQATRTQVQKMIDERVKSMNTPEPAKDEEEDDADSNDSADAKEKEEEVVVAEVQEPVTDADLEKLADAEPDTAFEPITGTNLGSDTDVVQALDEVGAGEKVLVSASTGAPVKGFDELVAGARSIFTSASKGFLNGNSMFAKIVESNPYAIKFGEDAKKNTALLHSQTQTLAASAVPTCCPRPSYVEDRTQYCSSDNLFTLPTIDVSSEGAIEWFVDESVCDVEDVKPFVWGPECGPDAVAPEELGEKLCEVLPCDGESRKEFVTAYGWCFEVANSTSLWNSGQLAQKLETKACKFEHALAQLRFDAATTIAGEPEVCDISGMPLVGGMAEAILGHVSEMRSRLCNQGVRFEIVADLRLRDRFLMDNLYRSGNPVSLAQIESAANVSFSFFDTGIKRDDPCIPIDEFTFMIYVPGAIRELRGGDIDFGVMRDSELNKFNKYRIMFETYRGMLRAGPECSIKALTLSGVCANGAVGPRVDVCAV